MSARLAALPRLLGIHIVRVAEKISRWALASGARQRRSTVDGMDVLIGGGHGQVARSLIRILARAGHAARPDPDPGHADLETTPGVPVVCDLEREDPAPHIMRRGHDRLRHAAARGGLGPEQAGR